MDKDFMATFLNGLDWEKAKSDETIKSVYRLLFFVCSNKEMIDFIKSIDFRTLKENVLKEIFAICCADGQKQTENNNDEVLDKINKAFAGFPVPPSAPPSINPLCEEDLFRWVPRWTK